MTGSIYQRVMGERFFKLALPVQNFHSLSGMHQLHGWVVTEAPATRLGKILAMLIGVPVVSTEGPFQFELHALDGEEIWERRFPFKTMKSTLSAEGGELVERLGVCRLSFRLEAAGDRLVMRLKAMHFAGIPCPGWLLPAVVAEERGANGQFHFSVEACLPVVGRVAGYRGYLVITEGKGHDPGNLG